MQVEKMIQSYFDNTEEDRLTITGLALVIGSKQLLNDYEGREDYQHIIRRAKLRIENKYELALSGKTPTGAIFALKNMGWRDSQNLDHTSGGKPITPKIIFADGDSY